MNLLDLFESINEGWSDAIVSQRTGQPRTPYSVYIKGRKWKDFENDDHAESVANKLRAKFKADGRDPSVITIAPTDYDKDIKEDGDRVDPILIKALNNMPDGLATHGEILNACYDAYAMELGKMRMKSEYGTTRVYVPKLMSLYKDKHGLTFNEAANPAQQAAIAIAKKKEQGVAEATGDSKNTIAKLMKPAFVDGSGGNFSYEVERKAPTMNSLRVKYHDNMAAMFARASDEELAQAAAELKALGWNPQEMEEGARDKSNTDPWNSKWARSLSDQELTSKQRWYSDIEDANAGALNTQAILNRELARRKQGVAEAQTDYQKRRQRERDIDAGKPVPKQRQSGMTDYQKRRAEQKRQEELGEGEREPYQQAIDQLTARRIDDLNMKLDDLVQRAKQTKNPEVKAALAKEFRKHKAERDSYFGIDPATGMNADRTLGTVKGALDEQSAPIKHRVAVTVTDPKHPDMDVMQRTCRVTGPDREKAINSAIAHYRREGFKVHDHHYIGVVDEGSMASAAHNSEGPKFGGYWKGTNPNPPKPGQGFGGCEESMEESMGPLGKITKHMAKSSWATSPSTKYELRKRRNPEQMAKRNGIAPVAEAKGLSKQVKIIQGPDTGKIGRIREIKLGAYKGAPKTYYIDLEDGGQANNLPGTALRLVKSEMTESLKKGEYYVWTVYFDDGTSKRIKVPSDEFDPYEYYKKQNKVVVNVDYSWDIQS
jgi:hypothetical protein